MKRRTDPVWKQRELEGITRANRTKRNTPLGRLQNCIWVARKRSKLRKLPCTITLQDLGKPPTFCPVLGLRLNYGPGKSMDFNRATLDRINNKKGYIPGNVHVISYRANSLKSNATLKELGAIVAYMT